MYQRHFMRVKIYFSQFFFLFDDVMFYANDTQLFKMSEDLTAMLSPPTSTKRTEPNRMKGTLFLRYVYRIYNQVFCAMCDVRCAMVAVSHQW